MGFILTYLRSQTIVKQLVCKFKRNKNKVMSLAMRFEWSIYKSSTFFIQYILIFIIIIDQIRPKGIFISLPQI